MSTTKGNNIAGGLLTPSNHPIVIADKFVIEKEIGNGSFATVYKGHLLSNKSESVAIKAVSRSKLKNKKLLENLEIEIAILKKIKHPHIVGLMECEKISSDFYLIMEYCALGDLTFFIKKRKHLVEKHPFCRTLFEKYPPTSEEHNGLNRVLVINFLQQLSSALKFLRSKNLVHRDIKPQNLLLSAPLLDYDNAKSFHERGLVGIYNLPILKIADFGFARFLPNTSLAETLCGSPLYMAPEILNYQRYNAKADLWSVGTVLYEMCCGRPPFKASNHLELFQKIKKANNVINFPKCVELEPAMVDLICSLLTFEPAKRMGFNDFFNNELVNEDLSRYEQESEPDLETKSRNVVESNMFISEYLNGKDKNRKLSSLQLSISKDLVESSQHQTPPTIKQVSNKDIKPLHGDQNAFATATAIGSKNYRAYDNSKSCFSALLLEKEYVVVEKNSVEVNALADEFAHAGSGLQAIRAPEQCVRGASQTVTGSRQSSTSTSPMANNTKQNLLRHNSGGMSSGGGSTSRRPSIVDRRLSLSSLGATNALSKALGMASLRLFGNNQQHSGTATFTQGGALSPLSSPQVFQDMIEQLVLNADHQWDNSKLFDIIHDDVILKAVENLTVKAYVIYSFAEVKFQEVTQVLSGSGHDLTPKRSIDDESAVDNVDDETDGKTTPEKRQHYAPAANSNSDQHYQPLTESTNELHVDEKSQQELNELCTETIVLYMKVLSLLAYAMHLTSRWWHESADRSCSFKLNILVQWIREKFNECLEKAQYLRIKIQSMHLTLDAEKQYPSPDLEPHAPVFVEKLIYDRALDISKFAAKMEMQGENLENCELAYSKSLWMLESLLDVINEEDNYDADNLGHTGVLDSADKDMIKIYIDSIANRLKALRRKISR
ncbi:HEL249Wp [Eremothecium sinecaudum]|uniref:Serine/threonine-protein kinase ATG1 n=1 Tax=Eremothecium sinecaudum TaxID=45286 RepID=A0A109UZA1_9SACH|nr:HEL249Wp [Eremothecium sinecaudum]AMD21032.1 HEL249Wp [Eremothecium sinecaudum]